ncbi:MAG: YhdT family protein [Mogibacterium sp.]|nr:YhdT family protein [Mogibacterium sp.]
MNKPATREEKDRQIRREARATFILFAICFVWHVGWAFGLSGTGIRVAGLPLWWLLSTPGVFVVAVIGVVYLLKKVFVDMDFEEGGADNDR